MHSQNELLSQRLVAACLSSAKPGTQFIVDPLLHSPSWLEWLRLAGFVHQRPFTRMSFGANRVRWRPRGNVDNLWSRVWLMLLRNQQPYRDRHCPNGLNNTFTSLAQVQMMLELSRGAMSSIGV